MAKNRLYSLAVAAMLCLSASTASAFEPWPIDFSPRPGAGSTPVPEPASLLLLGAGLAIVGLAVRRRRK